MSPVLVVIAIAGLVAAATAIGLVWRARQGRVRQLDDGAAVSVKDIPGIRRFGSGATLLQFSTEVCSPCKTTHALLDRLATELPAVTHVDVDVTNRPDLAALFRIMQTPTTLILDRRGIVRARIGGAPRIDSLRAELDHILTTA